MALLETLLFVSAEMEDGLGLLVTTRSHGLTSAQLLQRVCGSGFGQCLVWEAAARNGHVHVLRWLRDNTNFNTMLGSDSNCICNAALRGASRGGDVDALKFLSEMYVIFLFLFFILINMGFFISTRHNSSIFKLASHLARYFVCLFALK